MGELNEIDALQNEYDAQAALENIAYEKQLAEKFFKNEITRVFWRMEQSFGKGLSNEVLTENKQFMEGYLNGNN